MGTWNHIHRILKTNFYLFFNVPNVFDSILYNPHQKYDKATSPWVPIMAYARQHNALLPGQVQCTSLCVWSSFSWAARWSERIETVADVGYASCQNSLLDQVIQ